jgi:transforming growth factor-beta-induced protein
MKRFLILPMASLAIVLAACSSTASTSPSAAAPVTPAATPVATPAATPAASPDMASASPRAAGAMGDVVATADSTGTFKTLLAAATAAGLVETLQGKGPFTVFAPTDEAFAALPAGTLDGLLADPEALKKILLYHVVSGAVTADQVVGLTSANTVEGSPIAISVKDGKVYLNDSAQVIKTDIMASNGVIHVIDKVLLPPTN